MKNKIQRLIMIVITGLGSLSQIGCYALYDTTCEVDLPDRLETREMTIIQTFNGLSLAKTTEFGDYIFNRNLEFDLDPYRTDFGSTVAIENGSVTSISDIQTYMDWGFYEDKGMPILEDFPIRDGQEKIFNVAVDIEANYFTIENLNNSKKVSLPPVSNFVQYAGWASDTSIQIQDANYGDGYIGPLDKGIINITDLENLSLEFNAENTDVSNPVTMFPDTSPMGNLKVDMRSKSKLWTGTVRVKLIQNAAFIFQMKSTITLENSGNVLVKEIDAIYDIKPEEHYTEQCSFY